nr:MAG TPA: hypothetical protein [Caudoviricetes sp.]DAS74262.1 MAG TPA: hypothetical protein [Caudoviricetes sp.]DAS78953.1 MAG TPA: hypothetical protein [Caudoviricetes sp.]
MNHSVSCYHILISCITYLYIRILLAFDIPNIYMLSYCF